MPAALLGPRLRPATFSRTGRARPTARTACPARFWDLADTNPLFHKLLSRFKALTGCPILVNTSFNVRGEPIVCTPEDAFRCFMGNELDVLVADNCVLQKAEQDPTLRIDYSSLLAD